MATKSGSALVRSFFKMLTESKSFDRVARGAQVLDSPPSTCVCEMEIDEGHTNKMGTLHGGFSAYMVDMVTTCALMYTEAKRPGVSVDLHVSYLAPAKIGETVVFDGRVTKAGRNLAFTTCDITRKSDGVLVAQGRHTKAFPPS